MMSDDRTIARHDLAGNMKGAWIMSADSLLAGARALIDLYFPCVHGDQSNDTVVLRDEKVLKPAFLLYGFALENLLKALWVSQGNRFVENRKFNKVPSAAAHNLCDLARVTNFKISGKEGHALALLSVKLIATGRYPIAKNWENHKPMKAASGGLTSASSFNSYDVSIFEELVRRLLTDLGERPQDFG